MWNFQGFVKKEVVFQKLLSFRCGEFPRGQGSLLFCPWIFQGIYNNMLYFTEFAGLAATVHPAWSAIRYSFVWNFQAGHSTGLKQKT